MAAVWFVSDSVSADLPDLPSDKLLHVVAYGLFGVANLRAFHGGFRRPTWWASLGALALTVGFGALDEWRQSGVSMRTASWSDWAADAVGGLTALLVLRWVSSRRGVEQGPRRQGDRS
jgi:VanZ family protein